VAAFAAAQSSQGPVEGLGYARVEPPTGWSGYSFSAASPTVAAPGYAVSEKMLALDDQNLFVAHGPTSGCVGVGMCTQGSDIDVYATRGLPTPPSASGATVSGAAVGRPRIALRLMADANSPAIASVTLRLPSGMSFRNVRSTLPRGLSVSGAGGYSFDLRGGTLIIHLDNPAGQVLVSLAPPAVAETGRLRHRVTRNMTLKLQASVVDSDSNITRFLVPLTIH
jgi:hypothetical protein